MKRILLLVIALCSITACSEREEVVDSNNRNKVVVKFMSSGVPTVYSNLIETPILIYDEEEVVVFEWKHVQYETKFQRFVHVPFGWYMPELPDTEIEHYNVNITLYDPEVEQLTYRKKGILHYSEYLASKQENDQHIDYFQLNHDGNKYLLTFSYHKEKEEEAVPLLIRIVQTIRYEETINE